MSHFNQSKKNLFSFLKIKLKYFLKEKYSKNQRKQQIELNNTNNCCCFYCNSEENEIGHKRETILDTNRNEIKKGKRQ